MTEEDDDTCLVVPETLETVLFLVADAPCILVADVANLLLVTLFTERRPEVPETEPVPLVVLPETTLEEVVLVMFVLFPDVPDIVELRLPVAMPVSLRLPAMAVDMDDELPPLDELPYPTEFLLP